MEIVADTWSKDDGSYRFDQLKGGEGDLVGLVSSSTR